MNKTNINTDIINFVSELMNDTTHYEQTHFCVPTINLNVRFNRGSKLFGSVDTTTFTNADTGEEIITVPSNIAESSTLDEWKNNLKISQHSPVYRIIKAIFDGDLIARNDPEYEYDVDYDDYIPGYEIQTLYFYDN